MTYQQAAQAALDVQNACNMGGIARSFHEAVQAVWEEAHRLKEGTDWVNHHPITRLFADKIYDLADRLDQGDYRAATSACRSIVSGEFKRVV